MSTAAAITVVIALSSFMLASVLGVAYFISNTLGGRIDRIDDHLGRVEGVLQGLREDVAVLKATH